MKKTVIVINGKGGAGKDTLCDFAAKHYQVSNISSITPIKEIAKQYGWNGEKDNRSRKFLSDLKKVFTEYNELPTRSLVKQYQEFLISDRQILFVHIREADEIDKFKKEVEQQCVTLLIRRNDSDILLGNTSDDQVEDYLYDYYYTNDKSLAEAERDFILYLEKEILTKSV